MSHKLLKVLRDKNIDCIVAPFEADAQLAYLNKNQLIDVVLSEDSDLLVFGCSEFFSRLPQVLGVKSLHVPGPEYLLRFDEADQMFLHQVVFDPRNLRAVPLNPILDESEAPPELVQTVYGDPENCFIWNVMMNQMTQLRIMVMSSQTYTKTPAVA
ncbi:exonuclease 1-like [Montipora capricornis]|uniref:exonuclease 1-like n=1 Tax=Montipora capricornis TaxID=246305 RepID=UPI0035F1765B